MSEPRGPDCVRFDAHAEELALGHADEPMRADLLAHAATCADCQRLLTELVAVTDRLLVLAPEVEPPPGFEGRVLGRLDDHPSAASPPRRRRWVLAAAAVAIAAVGASVGVFVADRLADDGGQPVEAAVVSAAGDDVGTVTLVSDPAPHVLLTISAPRQGAGGVRVCELRDADGTWHEVGSWEAADIYSGVWAAGIDAELLDATAMRVTSDGEVVATAEFG